MIEPSDHSIKQNGTIYCHILYAVQYSCAMQSMESTAYSVLRMYVCTDASVRLNVLLLFSSACNHIARKRSIVLQCTVLASSPLSSVLSRLFLKATEPFLLL